MENAELGSEMNESLDFCYIPNCMLKKNQKKTTVEIEKIRDTKKAFIQRCSDAQRHYTINAEQTDYSILLRKETMKQFLNIVLLWAKNIWGDSGLTAVKSLCTSPFQKNPRNQRFSPSYEQQSKTVTN